MPVKGTFFFFFFPQRTIITSDGEVKKTHLCFEITHSLFGGKDIWKKWRRMKTEQKPLPIAWNSSFPESHWKRFSLYIIFIVLFAFSLSFSISWNYLFSTLCLSILSYWEFLPSWSFYNTFRIRTSQWSILVALLPCLLSISFVSAMHTSPGRLTPHLWWSFFYNSLILGTHCLDWYSVID